MRIAICLLMAALAGCLDSAQDLDEQTYDLQAAGIPSHAAVGQPFTFQMQAEGELSAESDHVGGHYWAQSTSDPDADFAQQAGGCQHLSGASDLPGTFQITCTIQSSGTMHLRGHVRIETDGRTINYWTPEQAIEVVDLALRIENATTSADVGQAITFDLHVEGTSQAHSDHIGAHYWTEKTEDPTADFADQAGACQHQAADLPAVLTVTCTWDSAGTYHVYGHVRLGDQRHLNLWTSAMTVQVS